MEHLADSVEQENVTVPDLVRHRISMMFSIGGSEFDHLIKNFAISQIIRLMLIYQNN